MINSELATADVRQLVVFLLFALPGCLGEVPGATPVAECPRPDGTGFVGTVHNMEGKPVAAATVTASVGATKFEAEVTKGGCYAVAVSARTTYTLRASAPGYAAETQSAWVHEGDAKTVTFALREL